MRTETRTGFDAPEVVLARQEPLTLLDGQVHVWCFELEADDRSLERCRTYLCEGEIRRAGRFAFDGLRRGFIVAHGVLRHLLARYLGCPPGEVEFELSPENKPSLRTSSTGEGKQARDLPDFNLSHSHDRAILALGRAGALGADVEMERDDVDLLALAASCFFRSEIETIRAAAGDAQRREFFRHWVAKEAVLKAQGVGLGFPLDQFEVIFSPDGQTARVRSSCPERLDPAWMVRLFDVGSGWPGAVAARGTGWSLRFMGTPRDRT